MPTPEKGEHWGILGGAFDPVHLGHTTLADDVCNLKSLSGVLFVPSVNHPFKKDKAVASFEQRVDMLKLAVVDTEYFLIDVIEQDRQLTGYTIDTLIALKDKYPSVTLSFLIGSDNIGQLSGWRQPERIVNEVSIIAGTRPGHRPHLTAHPILDRVGYIETRAIDVSSSEIREAFRTGKSAEKLDGWLNPKVKDYILSRSLYR